MATTSPELTTKIALQPTPANEREKRVVDFVEAARAKTREAGDKKAEHILENLKDTGLAPLRDPEIRSDIAKVIPGSNIGPDGKRARTSEEAEKAAAAERSGLLVKRFLESDYQRLDIASRQQIEGMLDTILSNIPVVQAQIESGILNKSEVIQNLLNNKQLKPLVRQLFEKAIKRRGEEAITLLEPKLQADFEKNKTKKVSLDQEKQRVVEQLNTVNETLNRFTIATGTEGEELSRLKGSKTTDELALRQALRDTEKKQTQYSRATENEDHIRDGYIDAQGGVHPPDRAAADTYHDSVVARIEKELEVLEAKKKTVEEKFSKTVQLETTKQESEAQKRQLQESLDRINNQLEDVNYNFHLTQVTLIDAQNKIAEKQDKYVQDMQTVIPQAIQELLVRNIEEVEAGQRELLVKEAEETTDKAKKGVLAALNNRWDRVVSKGTLIGSRQVTENMIPQINADFARMSFSGPKAVLKEILTSRSIGLTPEQADEKLADSAFVAEMEPKIVEGITRRKVATGKISEPEARLILESSWGQTAIQDALNKNTELRTKIQALKGSEAVSLNTFEWMKKLSQNKLVQVVVAILGIAGLAVGGLTAVGALGGISQLTLGGSAAEPIRRAVQSITEAPTVVPAVLQHAND